MKKLTMILILAMFATSAMATNGGNDDNGSSGNGNNSGGNGGQGGSGGNGGNAVVGVNNNFNSSVSNHVAVSSVNKVNSNSNSYSNSKANASGYGVGYGGKSYATGGNANAAGGKSVVSGVTSTATGGNVGNTSAGSSSTNGSMSMNSTSTYNQVKQAPMAYTPGMAGSFSQENCANSASLGASAGFGAIGGGMPIESDGCNRRKDVDKWLSINQPLIACYRMIDDENNAKAMQKTGLTCEIIAKQLMVR